LDYQPLIGTEKEMSSPEDSSLFWLVLFSAGKNTSQALLAEELFIRKD
jgi:hypothetical protein